MGNLWLFAPVLKPVLGKISAQAGAMLQTTVAFTMQSGSDACNVLPQEATVSANMRFIPHQGEKESFEIIRKIAEKHGLETEVIHANDYTPGGRYKRSCVPPGRGRHKRDLPRLPVSPYVMTGATDAQFYQPVCKSCIRFAPVIYGPEQMKGMHGLNENIEYNCLARRRELYKISSARRKMLTKKRPPRRSFFHALSSVSAAKGATARRRTGRAWPLRVRDEAAVRVALNDLIFAITSTDSR